MFRLFVCLLRSKPTTMLYFTLSVLLTVSLYLLMQAFSRYGVNALHAVLINYFSCVALGLLLSNDSLETVNWGSTGTLTTLGLGSIFVLSFLLIGQTTVRAGVTSASLASNLSLVIPVLFGLFVFKNSNKTFTFLNYLGLLLAVIAVALSAFKKEATAQSRSEKSWVWALPVLLFLITGTSNTLINYVSSAFYRPDQAAFLTTIACTGSVVCGMLVLAFRMLAYGDKITLKSILGGLLLGVLNFLSFYFLLLTLQSFGNSAAFVFPIYNILCILVSALSAFLLFKETLQPLNKWGLVVAVVALLLISYQELGF
jgi:multidrug transporter EmrE-like cation transporter